MIKHKYFCDGCGCQVDKTEYRQNREQKFFCKDCEGKKWEPCTRLKEDGYVDMKGVLELVPVCKATICNKVNAGTFPKYRKMGTRTFWLLSEIQAYLAKGEPSFIAPSACQGSLFNELATY